MTTATAPFTAPDDPPGQALVTLTLTAAEVDALATAASAEAHERLTGARRAAVELTERHRAGGPRPFSLGIVADLVEADDLIALSVRLRAAALSDPDDGERA